MIQNMTPGKIVPPNKITQLIKIISPDKIARLSKIISPDKIARLSNKDLYRRCREYGANIRKFLKEFALYLPEVEKRALYKQYGCHTLYEFAAKLAGMTKDTVDDILNVHKKLEDKPVLQGLIGQQGWSKVKVVATVATPETEIFWAEKVQIMSKETLKTFVKELKKEAHEVLSSGQDELFAKTENLAIPWPEPSKQMEASQKTAFTLRIDDEAETKLRIFKQRLEKKIGEPQDWNQTIKELLKIVEEYKSCTKSQKSVKKLAKSGEKPVQANQPEKPAPAKEQIQESLPCADKRYIPAPVKHCLEQKYKGKCGYPKCTIPSGIYHHTKRFSLEPNHDPEHIVPLCKPHERLAHHGLIANEDLTPENWKITLEPDKSLPKYKVDLKVQQYRFPVN